MIIRIYLIYTYILKKSAGALSTPSITKLYLEIIKEYKL